MNPSQSLTISETHHHARVDQVLSEHYPQHSRSLIRKWLDQGMVSVNDAPVSKAGQKLKVGDVLTWQAPEIHKSDKILPEAIPLDICFEDDHVLVVNKPVGMVVHPAPGHYSGTLVNALLHHCSFLSGIGGVERPGIVHRLDRETSGLLAVAKTDQAHQNLSAQLQARTMKRHYDAIAEQNFGEETGSIEAPIARHPVKRQQMAIVENGRYARTHWHIKGHYHGYTWLGLELDTGRTHQIRVHLKSIHHPLVGDEVYGSKRKHPFKVERPMLHASRLQFLHPVTDEPQQFEVPVPADFQRILDILAKRS